MYKLINIVNYPNKLNGQRERSINLVLSHPETYHTNMCFSQDTFLNPLSLSVMSIHEKSSQPMISPRKKHMMNFIGKRCLESHP